MKFMTDFRVFREFVMWSPSISSPTRMHPLVSVTQFPEWMRTPSNPFTPTSKGSHVPNLGLFVISTGYVPVGIAVPLRSFSDLILFSLIEDFRPTDGGSNVTARC